LARRLIRNLLETENLRRETSRAASKNSPAKLGELAIADIKVDLKSRDDTPPLLLGLQFIYTNLEKRSQVFSILEEVLLLTSIMGD
jgi:hypothetical protein